MKLEERKELLDLLKPHLMQLYNFSEKDFLENFSSYYYNYIDVPDKLFLFVFYLKMIWIKSEEDYEICQDCLRNICLIIGNKIPFNYVSEYDFLAR